MGIRIFDYYYDMQLSYFCVSIVLEIITNLVYRVIYMKITFGGTVVLLCFAISIVFCIVAWIMNMKKNKLANWASVCSLSFVAITLLMEYRAVLEWVNKEDWSALMDVVPSTFPMLCGYVILMLLSNSILIFKGKTNIKE